jgi:hypothetical protein
VIRVEATAARAAFVTAGSLFAGMAGASCGGDKGYPASAKTEFVQACAPQLSAKKAKEACECAFEEVQRTVPYAAYKEAADAIRAGRELEPSTAMTLRDAVNRCIGATGG